VPVLAVRGNGDDGGGGRPLCPDDPRMKYALTIDVGGVRIGMTHDATLPEWPPHRTLETIMEHEFGGPVDVFVHGHTHVPAVEATRGVLLVNPGSPTFPRNLNRQLGTVGLMTIHEGKAHPWIHQLGEPVLDRRSRSGAPFVVRPATVADAAEVASVEVASWRAAYRGIMPDAYLSAMSVERQARVWARALDGERSRGKRTLVATVERSIVGYAMVGRDKEGGDGLLYLMYVLPQWWGSGAGDALMASAEQSLAELGHARSILWVLETNTRARRFYERRGWSADDATQVDDYGGTRLQALRMTNVRR
jgi:putative phosphoesterase